MSGKGLFEDLPGVESLRPVGSGKARRREPLRGRIELWAVERDSVLIPANPKRVTGSSERAAERGEMGVYHRDLV